MAGIRFQIDLFIPEDAYNNIPAAKKTAIRDAIRALKSCAVKVNEGQANEEMTVVAQWHKCRHDEGASCEESQDI